MVLNELEGTLFSINIPPRIRITKITSLLKLLSSDLSNQFENGFNPVKSLKFNINYAATLIDAEENFPLYKVNRLLKLNRQYLLDFLFIVRNMSAFKAEFVNAIILVKM